MDGLVICDVSDFVDADGDRWRQIRLGDGSVVQTRLSHPWLIFTPSLGPAGPVN